MDTTAVGIIGGSGFTGAELLRLCASHPNLDVKFATGDSQAGTAVAALYPNLAPAYPSLEFVPYETSLLEDVSLVFVCLPHGASQGIMKTLVDKVGHVIDLGADFRLQDASLYPTWYGDEHTVPELLPLFGYGLPEIYRSELLLKDHVAVPGCYPTAAALALAPLAEAGLIEKTGVIVDAATGVSGGGRPPKPGTTFCAVDEDYSAYGLLNHRHTIEMEIVSGTQVLFTPHMAPMSRGILATCYARAASQTSTDDLLDTISKAYEGETFITVMEESPHTKATFGSNSVHITARYDERTGTVLAIAAIDNLLKGASGQALQCANLILGLAEDTGLAVAGIYP